MNIKVHFYLTDELEETRARVQKSGEEAIYLKSKLTEVQKHVEEKSEMVVDLQGILNFIVILNTVVSLL